MQESGDPELIFCNTEDGTFISASDTLKQRFSGPVQGEETHSTDTLRHLASVLR